MKPRSRGRSAIWPRTSPAGSGKRRSQSAATASRRCSASTGTFAFPRTRTPTRPTPRRADPLWVEGRSRRPRLPPSPEECFFAAGFHRPDPLELGRLRASAARAPKAFKERTAKLKKAGPALSGDDALTRRPRERRSRCSSPIRGASSGSASCAFADQAEPETSSHWAPRPKICGSWRSSIPLRRRSSPHEARSGRDLPR